MTDNEVGSLCTNVAVILMAMKDTQPMLVEPGEISLPRASTGAPSAFAFCSIRLSDFGSCESIRLRSASIVPPDCMRR